MSFQSACVLSIEILQPCLLDRDNLSLHMRKFGMVLENECRRPRRYRFIPTNGRGLLPWHYGVVIALIEAEHTVPLGIWVEVSIGKELQDRPNDWTRLRRDRDQNVRMMIE